MATLRTRVIPRREKKSGSKYEGIGLLLDRAKPKTRIRLTFLQIERETGALPDSARRFPSWWANNRSPRAPGRHSRVWLSRGYWTRDVDLTAGAVTFFKNRKEKTRMSMAELILESACALAEEGRSPFSRREIAVQVVHIHPALPLKLQAIDPAIQAMTVQSSSGRLVAERWRNTLARVRRGEYKLSARGKKTARALTAPAPTRGKSLLFHLKQFFREQEGLTLTKGTLRLSPHLAIPMDLVSRDRRSAVKILALRAGSTVPSGRGRKWGLFQALYVMEKAGVKRPILVLHTPARPRQDNSVKKFLQAYRPLLTGIHLYLCTRPRGGAPPGIEKL